MRGQYGQCRPACKTVFVCRKCRDQDKVLNNCKLGSFFFFGGTGLPCCMQRLIFVAVIAVTSLVTEQGSRVHRFSSCSTRAQ